MNEYGPLAGLVASVVALLSAGAAITVAWVRNADWAPPEDDVPSGPAKVATLLATIIIAALWFETGKQFLSNDLEKIAITCGILSFLFLLIYSFFMGMFVFYREVTIVPNKIEKKMIIGGLCLTSDAKLGLKKAKTIQRLFEGSGYDHDLVCPRWCRSVVKTFFIISFTGLQLFGSVAIASIALSVDPKASENSQLTPTGSGEAPTPQSAAPSARREP
jgi:hypothetical protein